MTIGQAGVIYGGCDLPGFNFKASRLSCRQAKSKVLDLRFCTSACSRLFADRKISTVIINYCYCLLCVFFFFTFLDH